MKRNKTIKQIAAIGMLTMLVGCSQSDSIATDKGTEPLEMEVRVTTSIAPPASRAANLTSDNLDRFGIMINTLSSGNNWKAESTASRTKTGDVWQPWGIAPVQSWLNTTNSVEVLAYAPYQTTSPITSNAAARILTFDATTQPGTEPIDWVYYYSGKKVLSALVDSEGAIPVTFTHFMSRLRVEIKMREEMEGLKSTAVEILNTKPTAEWSTAATSTIIAKGDVTTIYTTATGEAENCWSTFIVPQIVDDARLMIRVKVNGKTYTYTNPYDFRLYQAEAYKFTLNLGREKLELAPNGITVVDWETGEEIPGGNMTEKP